MNRIFVKCASVLAAGSVVLAATPAEARPPGYRGGHVYGVGHRGHVGRGYVAPYAYRGAYMHRRYGHVRGYYPGYYRPYPVYYGYPRYYGYPGYYGHYHHHDGVALAIGAGLIGVLVGTAIAPRREYHYYREEAPPPQPPPVQDYPPAPPMGERG